jgi:hypothetical protein
MALPTYQTSTMSSSTTETSPHSVTIPTHDEGDGLILFYGCTVDPVPTVSTPSGWTLIGSEAEGDLSAVRLTVFTKYGDGVESSVSVSMSGNAGMLSGVVVCKDIDLVPNQWAFSTETGTVSSQIMPTVTTTVDNCIVLRANMSDDDDPTSTNWDDSLTETARNYDEMATPGNGACMGLVEGSQTTAGATGTQTFDNQATEHHKAITLAFPYLRQFKINSVSQPAAVNGVLQVAASNGV